MRYGFCKALFILAVAIVCGGFATGARAATLHEFQFLDNFDTLAPGARYTDVSDFWTGWNGTSAYESPTVHSTYSFSAGNALANANSAVSVPEEQRTWFETRDLPALTGGDAVVRFKFLRTVDQGTSSPNKIAVNLVERGAGDIELNKFAIDIYNNSVFNNSTDLPIFGSVPANSSWYELELRASWNAAAHSFGQSAAVTVRNAQSNAIVGSGSVSSKFATSLSRVDEVQIVMDAGYDNGAVLPRPTNFIDDLSLTGMNYSRSATSGHEYVRSRPLTTMSLVQLEETFIPSQYRDQAGLNTLLAWKPRAALAPTASAASMPWHMQIYRKINADHPDYAAPLTDEIKDLSRQIYDANPGNTGWMMWDEPRRQHFEKIAEGMTWYRSQFPDSLVYSNVYSAGAADGKYYYDETYRDANGNYPAPPGGSYNYDQYLTDYLNIVQPDVLLVDAYPYPTNTNDFIPTRYFLTLEKIRSHAKSANIPYWNFIQTVQSASYVLPSESDLRMNVYSSLGYGFTGLAYFLYHDPAYYALLDAEGQPTSLFQHTGQINAEVANLGDTLKLLTSTQVHYVRGSQGSLPTGTTAWASKAGGSFVASIVATKTGSMPGPSRGDVMIGHFKPMDDDLSGQPEASGELYFMLVNLLRGSAATAADASQSVRLDFDFGAGGINTLLRLNRLTGEPERVALIHDSGARYHVSVAMPGGTGDLFKFGDGDFAGIPSGDADLDGDVDLSDLGALAGHYGATSGARWQYGDFDLDGDVDLNDLGRLAGNYGAGASQAFADFQAIVPEPSTAIAPACILVIQAWLGRASGVQRKDRR